MDETLYGLRVTVPLEYHRAIELTTKALKQEGFGMVTSVEVEETLQQELDAEFRKYTILGACNPSLAHRGRQAEIDIGLLLPCNVVVYEAGPRESVVTTEAPLPAMGTVGTDDAFEGVAREADERLRRVLQSLLNSRSACRPGWRRATR